MLTVTEPSLAPVVPVAREGEPHLVLLVIPALPGVVDTLWWACLSYAFDIEPAIGVFA